MEHVRVKQRHETLYVWVALAHNTDHVCREERDAIERDAKNKEWAAQEAERAGEWYYKEVRHHQQQHHGSQW